jgi:hypothetical protein
MIFIFKKIFFKKSISKSVGPTLGFRSGVGQKKKKKKKKIKNWDPRLKDYPTRK